MIQVEVAVPASVVRKAALSVGLPFEALSREILQTLERLVSERVSRIVEPLPARVHVWLDDRSETRVFVSGADYVLRERVASGIERLLAELSR